MDYDKSLDSQGDINLSYKEGTHEAIQTLVFTQSQRNPVSEKPDFDLGCMSFLFPQNDATEKLYGILFSPDDWVVGTPIKLQIHILQEDSGQAVMKCDYIVFGEDGVVLPESPEFSTYIMNIYKNDGYVSGKMTNVLMDHVDIDTSAATGRAMIRMIVYRDDNVYQGDLKVDYIMIKYTAQNVVK
jgi:hypothetical protein